MPAAASYRALGDVLNEGAMRLRNRRLTYATADEAYHAFVDRSRRKPYECGICGRDITDPYHQPAIPGTIAVVQSRNEEPEEVIESRPEPQRQMQLF